MVEFIPSESDRRLAKYHVVVILRQQVAILLGFRVVKKVI